MGDAAETGEQFLVGYLQRGEQDLQPAQIVVEEGVTLQDVGAVDEPDVVLRVFPAALSRRGTVARREVGLQREKNIEGLGRDGRFVQHSLL